jgi:hypothetical protein
MKQAVKAGEILLPPGISVARRMIESWYIRENGYSLNDLQGEQSWRP